MKPHRVIAVLIGVFFLWSCAPKQIIPEIFWGTGPGDRLFAKAKKRFESKLYERALELYTDYLVLYPDRPLAPAALLKMGAIHATMGNYDKARTAYNQIADKYPDSYFAPDGILAILTTYYIEGRYNDVIENAGNIKDDDVSDAVIVRKYTVLGDAHIALGSYEDGINTFKIAYNKTKGLERKSLVEKLQKTVSRLPSSDISSLLHASKHRMTREVLLYQLGLKNISEDKYEEAITALSEFISEFPEHKNATNAKDLIDELSKETAYNHNAIGCLLPLSGRYKVFGERALKGIELALEQFSQSGENQEIEIFIEDTGANPETAELGVKKMAAHNVAAIIGPIITAEDAAFRAEEEKIPIITLTQKEQITQTGDYVFRNFLTPRMQVETLVAHAVDELGLSRFAILYPMEKYGTTFMNLFWDEVMAYGGEVVGVESYNSESTDFAIPIKKLAGLHYEVPEDLRLIDRLDPEMVEPGLEEYEAHKDPRPEVKKPEAIVDFEAIFIPDGPEKAGLILPQLVYYDIKDVYLFGTNLWHSDRLIEMARHHMQGAIMPEIFFAESGSREVRDFVASFEYAFGEKPGFIEALAYDTAMLLFELISRPDVRFRTSIKETLKTMPPFYGITGPTSFGQDGDAHKKLHLLEISGKRFVEVKHK
jgi:branched-chain amino acid transport system substrate-binding protein